MVILNLYNISLYIIFIFYCNHVNGRPPCTPEPPCSLCEVSPTKCTSCVASFFLLGDECIPCTPPCIGCLSPTKCFDCDFLNSGYFLEGFKCTACPYPCLTCSDPTFCYSCGWDAERRHDNRYCQCLGDYYHYDQQCILCISPCVACTSPEFCFDCDSLNSGLYANTNGECVPCVYPCLTCFSETVCIECVVENPAIPPRIQDGSCKCAPGWWDDTQECRPCLLPCTECTSETFCLYCGSDTSQLYADTDGLCKQCYYPCVNCIQMSPPDCLSCGWDIENRITDRQVNKSCTCQIGFYECGTKCKPCVPPCKACTSETNCIDCNNATSGSFFFEDNCKPCAYPCETCQDMTTCIKCGYDKEIVDGEDTGISTRNDNGICDCRVGFYESGYSCVRCILPCIECTSPTFCLDCNDVESGFYLNSNNKCISCPYPCVKCSEPTNCYECGWDLSNRIESHPQCICKPGLFEWGITCLSCEPPCFQCAGSAINCLTCIEGTYLDGLECKFCLYPCLSCSTQTECITCGWGADRRYTPQPTEPYFEHGEQRYHYDDQSCRCLDTYYLENRDCLPCVLPCVTCSDKHVCITFDCENSVSNKYYDSDINDCVLCPYPCLNCNDDKTCIDCGYTPERRNNAPLCTCADTYYQEGQICLPCQKTCVKCTTATDCIDYDYQEDISSQYYDSVSGTMKFCEYPCKTCKNSPTNCLSCGYDFENRNNDSVCFCKDTFYEDGQVCRPCVRPCITCSSQDICITISCQKHTNIEGNELDTKMSKTSLQCQACQYPCLTCREDSAATVCLTCGYGAQNRVTPRYLPCYYYRCSQPWEGTCRCKSGFYEKGQECLPCVKPCITCTSQTVCTSTTTNCNYKVSGLYLVVISGEHICKPCEYPCDNCLGGAGKGYCISCGYGKELRKAPNYSYYYDRWYNRECNCLSTYYEEDQECKKCQLPCLTCTSLTECLTIYDCDDTISGLFRNGIECQPCEYPCKTCRSSAQNCLSCGWDIENREGTSGSQNCRCKPTFYEDLTLQSCIKCVLPCLTCTDEVNCIDIYDCDQNISGYYPEGIKCELCKYPCTTCSSATHCLTCGYEPELRDAAPTCACKSGTYSYLKTCLDCPLPCKTCTDESHCITTYDCDQENSGMYPANGQCNLCVYPCNTCESATVCLSCKGDLTNRLEIPTCECEDGYYSNEFQECSECQLPCLTCTSATVCKTRYDCDYLNSGYYRSGNSCVQCNYPCINCSSSNSCVNCYYEITNRENNSTCYCKSGYYQDSNKVCMRCRLPCKTCTGPGKNQCQTYQDCMPGEYRTGYLCVPCIYPCRTCQNNGYCNSCGYGPQTRFIPGNNPYNYRDCRCLHGYYHFAALKKCLPCLYPCTTCYDSVRCGGHTDCNYTVTKMFYESNTCKVCQYPCETCNSYATNCYSCGYGGPSVRIQPVHHDRRCKCKPGYYENNQECIKCQLPCVECSDILTCITVDCKNDITNQYWDTNDQGCRNCEYPCLTCNNNALDCKVCYNNPERRQAIPNCSCLPGYYEVGVECLECILPCATCTSPKTCITYDCSNATSGLYLFTPPNVGQYEPTDCDQLTLLEQEEVGCRVVVPYCVPCVFPCRTCNSETECIDCGFSPQFRQAPNCFCSLDSYVDKQACIFNGCNHPCLSCSSSASACDSCADGYYKLPSAPMCLKCLPECVRCSDINTCTACDESNYLDQDSGKCIPCDYPCITCKTKTFCLTCGSDFEFRNKPPLCTCLFDFQDINGTCLKCIKPCDTCFATNVISCNSCIDGYYLNGNVCANCPVACNTCTTASICQSCSEGYYKQGFSCLQCIYPCLTCMNETHCLTCYEDVDKRFPAPNCECNNIQFDFYDNGSNCTDCDDPMQSCNPITNFPISCIDEYYLNTTEELVEFFVEDASGDIQKLKDQCDPSNCTGSPCPANDEIGEGQQCHDDNKYIMGKNVSFVKTECLPCQPGATGCSVVVEEEVFSCKDGYYQEGKNCIQCKSPCEKCINETYCLVCGYDPTGVRSTPPSCKCPEELSDHGTRCDTCTDPCETCFGFGIDQCLTCKPYHYLDVNTCKPCHDSCYYCDGPNETDCNFTQIIKCRDKYYPEDNLCKQCKYPCETCSNDTYCYTCVSQNPTQRYDVPYCNCFDELSDDGQFCIQCSDPCRTCTGTETNQCLTCIKGYYLQGTECPQCHESCSSCSTGPLVCQSCSDNWFLSGEECLPCVYPCKTCYQIDRCYTCGFVPERRYDAPGCNCKLDYTEYLQQCIECKPPCKTCTGINDNECVTCDKGYFLDGTNCIQCDNECDTCDKLGECLLCKQTFYKDSDGKTCLPCQPPCETCLSATFCHTCGYTPSKRIRPPTCECKIEYTPIGKEQCGACTPPCQQCETISDQDCITCIDSYYLNGTSPTNCLECLTPCFNCEQTNTNCVSCIDGYFFDKKDDGSSNCTRCEYPCDNCFSLTQCVTCGYDPQFRSDAPGCKCVNGRADTGVTCEECLAPCIQCNSISSTNCKSCAEGRFLDGTECKLCDLGCVSCTGSSDQCSSCESGYYQDGTTCKECKYPCQTCYSETQCVICFNDVDKRRAIPTCECWIDHYSDDGSGCIECLDPCHTCNSLANNDCTSCIDGYYLEIDTTICQQCPDGCKQCDPNDPVVCHSCFDEYYMYTDINDSKVKCKACESPCKTCEIRGGLLICLTCGFGEVDRIGPPLCLCNDDLNDAGYGCVECGVNSHCQKCFGVNNNECSSCQLQYVLDVDTNICEPCQIGCAICDFDNRSNCSLCIDTYFLRGNECLECQYPCITCLESDFCYTCGFDGIDGNFRRNIPPSCSCKDDFSDNGVECVLCTGTCLTCMGVDSDQCLTCVKGTYLQIVSGDIGTCETCIPACSKCNAIDKCQECNPTWYLDGENQVCEKCVYPCETCLTATFCYTCGYDINNKYSPPDCNCQTQFSDSLDEILGCITCVPNCKTCMTENSNDCTSCLEDYYLDGTNCEPCHEGCNICQDETADNCSECNDGYYLQGTQCIICKHPCVTCLSDTRCLTCITGAQRGLPPNCACENTFYDDGINGDCVDCPTPGGVCNNNDPNIYITCEDGYYRDNQTETFDCIECPSFCNTCSSATFCYECSSSENRGAAPWCQCAVGYYHNGTDCEICPFPSTVCKTDTEFYACADTYYVQGTTCQKCSYPCINCLVDLTCLTCGYDIEDRNPIPQCTCKTGYYDQKDNNGDPINDCVLCPSPSIECISETEFLSCVDEYYHNSATNECLSCVYPCKLCVSDIFCISCGYDLEVREDAPTCFCTYGDYYQKNPSDRVCTKCTDDSENCIKCKSYSECLSCVDGFTLEGTVCVPCMDGCGKCIGPICLVCDDQPDLGSNAPSCDCLNETSDSGTYRTCYDNSDPECAPKPCIPPCQNCNDETDCITCLPGKFREEPPDCNCITGFRQDILNNCVIPCDSGKFAIEDKCFDCQHPCSECDGEAHKCTACKLGYKMYGNNTCGISCVFPCSDCLDDDPFTCKSICAGMYRDINKNCACADTYYDEDDICMSCVHPCQNCSDISTCASCPDDGEQRKGPEDNCVCAEGYKAYKLRCIKECEIGEYELKGICYQCHIQCISCVGSGSHCLSCSYGYYKEGDTCLRCPINCKNCESDGDGGYQCTECEETAIGRYTDIQKQCACMEGYFERETIDCGKCTEPCVLCNTNRINCDTCVEEGFNRNPPPLCTCLDNFYAIDRTCKECAYTCKLCNFSATECLECYGTGIGRTTNLPDCECADTYFDNGEDDCQECEYPCVNCVDSSTNCLTCIFETESRNPAPDCNCSDKFFKEIDNHCLPCDWRCGTCEILDTQCLTCAEINREKPDCNCKNGYFGLDPNIECIKCHNFCKTCELTPENCLECVNTQFRNSKPDCSCIPGYYHDNDSQICEKCIHPCEQCSDKFTCLTCPQDGDLHRKDINFNCKCFTGYFSNGTICEKCDFKCVTCVDSATNCLAENPLLQGCENQCLTCIDQPNQCVQCKYGFQRNMQTPDCGCNEGYFIDENNSLDCQKCGSQCQTCNNRYTCITCKISETNYQEQLYPPYCNSNKNKFSKSLNGIEVFQDCAIQCETCEHSDNNCLKCSSGLNRSTQTPECKCQEGYYDNNFGQFNCQPCKKYCKSCVTFDICTICQEGQNRYLNTKNGDCECKKGYRVQNQGDEECVKCYQYGHQCYTVCPQNTFINESLLICEDYQIVLPSNFTILLVILFVLISVKLVLCTGILGKYQQRMSGLRPIEPNLQVLEDEDNKIKSTTTLDSTNQPLQQKSRINQYFQSGFLQGEQLEINLSSSSSQEDKKSKNNSDEFEPKLKQQQQQQKKQLKVVRGSVPISELQKDNNIDNNNINIVQKKAEKQRRQKPKLGNLISNLIGKTMLKQKQEVENKKSYKKTEKVQIQPHSTTNLDILNEENNTTNNITDIQQEDNINFENNINENNVSNVYQLQQQQQNQGISVKNQQLIDQQQSVDQVDVVQDLEKEDIGNIKNSLNENEQNAVSFANINVGNQQIDLDDLNESKQKENQNKINSFNLIEDNQENMGQNISQQNEEIIEQNQQKINQNDIKLQHNYQENDLQQDQLNIVNMEEQNNEEINQQEVENKNNNNTNNISQQIIEIEQQNKDNIVENSNINEYEQ